MTGKDPTRKHGKLLPITSDTTELDGMVDLSRRQLSIAFHETGRSIEHIQTLSHVTTKETYL